MAFSQCFVRPKLLPPHPLSHSVTINFQVSLSQTPSGSIVRGYYAMHPIP